MQTFRTYRAAVRGRGIGLRQQSVVLAFDIARIRGDAENSKAKRLDEYLDELLPAGELEEKRAREFIARMDAVAAMHAANEA